MYVLCPQDETDEQYLRKVADVMHSLFGTHGSTLLPLFDQLLPTFAGMLVSQNCIDHVHEFSSFISGYNSCIYLIRQLHFMIRQLHFMIQQLHFMIQQLQNVALSHLPKKHWHTFFNSCIS